MKLLKKTNRTYLIISASAFVIAGAVIYIVLSIILESQLNENLQSNMSDIILSLDKGESMPEYYPFVEVRKVAGQIERAIVKIDTMIFDIAEKENIPLRQISSVVSINGQMYLIVVRNTLIEKSDLLLSIGIVIGLLLILLIISLYYINRKFSLKTWQPFYVTLDNLREFSHSDTELKPSPVTDVDEFIELNRTLENLTTRVISDYQSLKRFTEDASHEIQSPVAVVQSKLETLMQHTDLKKDQVELIKSAYSSVQRISKLTQTLLLLTKIANEQYPGKIRVNLTALIEEKLSFFEFQFSEKSLILKKDVEPECYIETNFFLAESVIMNLLGNAVKHTLKGGEIRIRLDENCFEISNTGDPFPVQSSKLFDRFFKINKSSESLGLGLSIVKEICVLYKWQTGYSYLDGKHKFFVRF